MALPYDSAPKFQEYARPELLVSTDWLAEHLDDPGLVVAESDEGDGQEPKQRVNSRRAHMTRFGPGSWETRAPSRSHQRVITCEPLR
jgi:hypothetical protein